MTVPRDGDPICPTGAVRLVGRRGVVNRFYVGCTWSGAGHCTWCDKKVTEARRSTWCSKWCVDAFHATQPERQREAVEARDGGRCALCELDTGRFRLAVMRYRRIVRVRFEQLASVLTLRGQPTSLPQMSRLLGRCRWWDMDHTIPISEGGHPYDLRNLRTLCYWCHSRVTSEGAARRAGQRRRHREHEKGQGSLFGEGRPKM